MRDINTSKKLTIGIIVLILLSIALFITTTALVYSMLSESDALFESARVEIDLNGGLPIIDETGFAPGMTIEKEFFIKNNGSADVYYKLFFDNLKGDLVDLVEITILDKDKVLYEGSAKELSEALVGTVSDPLLRGDKKILTARFYLPDDVGNSAQEQLFNFDLHAIAVQTKNNPDRLFD